jgi:HSP20 family protein
MANQNQHGQEIEVQKNRQGGPQERQQREVGREERQSRGLERRPQGGSQLGRSGYGLSPFSMMRRMVEDMDRLFEDFGMGHGVLGRAELGGGAFTPALEVTERNGELVVCTDLPGVKKEDVKIEIDEDDMLVIQGERKSETKDASRSERTYGSFRRMVQLPRGVDVNSVSAKLEDGVLEVCLKLPEGSRRRSIAIESGNKPTKH